MVIGITGYSGAGKDTVGRVIQYLNCTNVGSTPISEAIHAEHDWWMEDQSGWEIKKFAGKLKEIASLLTGIPIVKFEDQEFKKTSLGPEWSMTVREFLQKLGTDGLRTGLHENVWLNALFADYTAESKWIVTDCRFTNEADIIKSKGGIIIRVDRPGLKAINNHPSETSMDDYKYDYRITNSSSVENLLPVVGTILQREEMRRR
jgi:hypothetical protein